MSLGKKLGLLIFFPKNSRDPDFKWNSEISNWQLILNNFKREHRSHKTCPQASFGSIATSLHSKQNQFNKENITFSLYSVPSLSHSESLPPKPLGHSLSPFFCFHYLFLSQSSLSLLRDGNWEPHIKSLCGPGCITG